MDMQVVHRDAGRTKLHEEQTCQVRCDGRGRVQSVEIIAQGDAQARVVG
jgi:hypothetical protein